MTDEEIIRRGVELADGWYVSDGQLYHEFGPSQYEFIATVLSDPDQYLLDGLAAQLTRQVDALGDYHFVSESYGRAAVIQYKNGNFIPRVVAEVEDKDRTMNTLRAIVESGVLEPNQNDN